MPRVCLVLVLCAASLGAAPVRAQTNIPLYVMIGMHSEQNVHYETNSFLFRQYRDRLVSFARMLESNGVMFSFQSDWTFLAGVTNYDRGLMTTNTAGTNVIAWLRSIGFDVDPHCHIGQSIYNYADVAALNALCGIEPSGVVGGYIATPVTNSQWGLVQHPITGAVHTSYVWTPKILWGGGNGDHSYEDNLWYSGMWRPMDATNFWTHSESSPLPNVGGYGNLDVLWTNLDQLVELRAAGALCTGQLYTCLIMSNMRDLDAVYQSDYDAQIQAHMTNANLHWVGITNLVAIWHTNFAARPSMLPYYMTNDFDGDGMNDGWEVSNFCGMAESIGTNDLDGDAMSDRAEFVGGSSPTDAADYFRVVTLAVSNAAGPVVTWSAAPGRTYVVDTSTNLGGPWQGVFTNTGPGPTMSYTSPPDPGPLHVRVGASL